MGPFVTYTLGQASPTAPPHWRAIHAVQFIWNWGCSFLEKEGRMVQVLALLIWIKEKIELKEEKWRRFIYKEEFP